MVFKRRNKRSLIEATRDFVYPKGGFRRAAQYVLHRMRRLPDQPHRIARGVFAGVLISFTPLFGVHFFGAALIAWVIRGNILAALLATFVGNPITFPFIAVTALRTGHWLLGIEAPLHFLSIVAAFSNAGIEIWENTRALFTAEVTQWSSLSNFFSTIFLPYLVGGLLPGLAVAFGFYFATIPVLHTYQKLRAGKLRDRVENRKVAKAVKARAQAEARSAAGTEADSGDDSAPGEP
ncbi:MAG TPA: DUF2062 domain-containing protein [Paracoccaceae bacterium]